MTGLLQPKPTQTPRRTTSLRAVAGTDVPCRCGGSELNAFEEVAAAAVRGVDGADVLATIAEAGRVIASATTLGIARLADGGGHLLVVVAVGDHARQLDGRTLELSGSVTGQALKMVSDGALSDDLVIVDDGLLESWTGQPGHGAGAVVVVPMTVDGSLVGAAIAVGLDDDDARIGRLRDFAVRAAVVVRFLMWQEHDRSMHAIDERERIADELHDAVIARLYGVGMQLDACVQSRSPDVIEDRVRSVVDTLDDVIRDLRSTGVAQQRCAAARGPA